MQGHAEEELVGHLRQQLVQDAEKLEGSALCDVLWSLGILDDLPVSTFRQLACLLEKQPLRDFQPSVRFRHPRMLLSRFCRSDAHLSLGRRESCAEQLMNS